MGRLALHAQSSRPAPVRRSALPSGGVTWHCRGLLTCGRTARAFRNGLVFRGVLAVAAAAVLAGCAGTSAPVKLPAKKTAAPAAATSAPGNATTLSTQKQAVTKAYLAFWAASVRAEDAGNAAKARTILAPYATAGFISQLISAMSPGWRKHEVVHGTATDHIVAVSLTQLVQGQYFSTVRDCQDASQQGFASASTGTLISGTLGAAHQEVNGYLSLVNGHWLVSRVTIMGDTCTS